MARDSDMDSLSRFNSELAASSANVPVLPADEDDEKLDMLFEEPSQSSLRRK